VLGEVTGATLLLDDAHGFGVLGEAGRGLFEAQGLWRHVNGGDEAAGGVRLAVCGTLAKALGGFGGIIPGTRDFVSAARRASHYFDGASPQPPAVTAAAARALEIVAAEPELRHALRENSRRLRDGLRSLGLPVPDTETAQCGVTLGDAERMRALHAALKRRGILVPYVPAYSGIPLAGVLRFAVFATHTSEQIDRLVAEIRELI
jgi:7-keto-8-aminopelargonate synthetase-like enzyme